MKKFYLPVIMILAFSIHNFVEAKDDHGHKSQKTENSLEASKSQDPEAHAEDDDHKGEDEHKHEENEEAHHDEKEHGGEEEGSSQVGPDKGILAASEKEGIKLSPEAEKNFGIQRQKINSLSKVEIQKTSVVTTGTEVNLFRFRNGFYKRVDFQQLNRAGNILVVRSNELQVGDEIVIAGLGYLRIAEITAFGGGAEGHSH